MKKNIQSLLILWVITLISCLIIYFEFIFGNEFFVFKDVGSDTYQQYLMQYNSIINSLRDGNLALWDFTNGLGTSMYAPNLFHPLLFLLYLAGAILGPMRVPHLMVYFEITQIFLAVTVFYFFLKEFPVTEKTTVITAYIYGFSGYMLVWGQHYQFGLYVILLPLLLLLVEKAIKKRRFSLPLAAAVGITVLGSVYMAYMVLLTTGIYLVIRLITLDDPIKERFKIFFKNCGSILLGIGIVAVVFLPNAIYLLTVSSRLGDSSSLLNRLLENMAPFSASFYETAFYRLFSSNLSGIADNYTGTANYYEAPSFFLSVLFVILLVQYLFTLHKQDTKRKLKIVQYVVVLLAVFLLLIKAGTMIYNGFAYAFSRHNFIVIPFAGLMIAFTLDQIFNKKRISYAGLFVSVLLFGLLYIMNPGSAQASTLVICILGCLMIAVLLMAHRKKDMISSATLSALLLILVMVNLTYDGYYSCNHRNTLKKDDGYYFEVLYGDDVNAALDYLASIDQSFYRIEKDYPGATYCMDGLTLGYYNVSTYNSTINKNVQEFVQKLWPRLSRMNNSEYTYNQTVYDTEIASLLNVKYLLSHSGNLSADGFTLLKQFGTIYIYENTQTESIGKFYETALSDTDLPKDTAPLDIDRFISENLILSDVDSATLADATLLDDYALEASDYTIENYDFSSVSDFTLPIASDKLAGYERAYMDFDINFTKNAVVSVALNDSFIYYTTASANTDTHLRLRVPATCDSIKISSCAGEISGTIKNITFSGSTKAVNLATDASVSFDKPAKDTIITGSAITKNAGYLLLSIPYEDGWHAYVNGEEVKMLRGDYGFITLALDAGEHDITLKYHPRGLTVGIWISIGSIILFMGIWLLRFKKKGK